MDVIRLDNHATTDEIADALEARARRLMAQRAATPTNWQFRKQRAALLIEVDETLDEWLLTR